MNGHPNDAFACVKQLKFIGYEIPVAKNFTDKPNTTKSKTHTTRNTETTSKLPHTTVMPSRLLTTINQATILPTAPTVTKTTTTSTTK